MDEFEDYENDEIESVEEDDETESTEEIEADDTWSTSDTILISGCGIGLVIIILTFFHCLKKTFKNMHIKIGNKIDIGIETKE